MVHFWCIARPWNHRAKMYHRRGVRLGAMKQQDLLDLIGHLPLPAWVEWARPRLAELLHDRLGDLEQVPDEYVELLNVSAQNVNLTGVNFSVGIDFNFVTVTDPALLTLPPGGRILLVTEGTYPYALGGVSSWCDLLVRALDEFDWRVLPGMDRSTSGPS